MTQSDEPKLSLPVLPTEGGELTEALEDQEQFITFQIGSEEYGLDILTVREVKAWTEITKLPNTAEFILGAVNLRGIILPVLDLRCRFGMGNTQPTSRHINIIVRANDKFIGILVDEVNEILTLTSGDIRPVPEMGFTIDGEFLTGLVTVEDRMVALIDVEKLFDMNTLLHGNAAENADPVG